MPQSAEGYDHLRWMRVALSLGQRHLGQTWPNPSVGCVLVKNKRVIARAATGQGGRPHAEAMALNKAGQHAQGSTAYVTLEPCAHESETPACAQLLIKSGVKRVVVAVEDPDERVSGQGIDILRSANVEVLTGIMEDEARRSHRGFFSRIEKNRPSITLKLAMSFDGKIATQMGHSQWITGPLARRYAHWLRAQHDAVLVGRGTIISDDPNLAPRGLGIDTPPIRIVVDSRLTTPHSSQLATLARRDPVWLCHTEDAHEDSRQVWQKQFGAKTFCCRGNKNGVDLEDALAQLAQQGLTRILCEGGSALAASLISKQLIDEIVGFNAGVNIGAEGLPAVGDLGYKAVNDGRCFRLMDTREIGGDIMHRWIALPNLESSPSNPIVEINKGNGHS